MKLTHRTLDGVQVVGVAGIVDSRSAGLLFDALVAGCGAGNTRLAVDLSGVHVMTRAGVRGLVVAAKLMKLAGGELRLCAAQRNVEDLLQGLGFNHLLKCDPTLALAVSRLAAGQVEAAPRLAADCARVPARAVAPLGAPFPAAARRPALYHGGAG
jgi:anti-anti-sigma factor